MEYQKILNKKNKLYLMNKNMKISINKFKKKIFGKFIKIMNFKKEQLKKI